MNSAMKKFSAVIRAFVCIVSVLFVSSSVSATEVTVRVNNDNDDAEELISDGDMYRDSTDLEFGYDDYFGGLQIVGMRFKSVNVPQGSYISSAYIEFEVDETDSGTTNLVIFGDDTDNAGGIGNGDNNLSNRTRTTATVNWSPSAWNSVGSKKQTSDISSIIQEIVNRSGWSANNHMVLMVEPGSGCSSITCQRTAESRDGESANAPLLVINYSDGASYEVDNVHGACGVDNLLIVEFDSTIDSDALDVGYYTLSSGVVNSVTQQSDTVVVLQVSGISAGQSYTLTVDGVDHSVDFSGLTGHYFDQRSILGLKVSEPLGLFTGNTYLRKDAQLNFDWQNDTPTIFPNISGNDERFSIRWDGYIVPANSGSYEFRLRSDDGIRLDFDGTEIVNDWSIHAPRYSSTSAAQALNGGQGYPIEVEHFEHTGQAVAELEWRRDGGSWEVVPAVSLSSCAVTEQAAGPVAEYRMDEASWSGSSGDVVDSSSSATNADSKNSLNTTATAHLCRAGDFDGVNDYIESSVAGATLPGTASMSFWLRTTQSGNNTMWNAPGISGVEDNGGEDDIFWGWIDASGHIGVSVGNDDSSHSNGVINDGLFHHVVLTRDATTGAYKIYIDGNLDKSGTTGSGIIGTSFSSIGRREGGTPGYFEGQLDEVKIYDRIISDAEVSALYNETRTCEVNSCAAYFPSTVQGNTSSSEIKFKDDAKVIGEADGSINFPNIDDDSDVLSCDTVACTVSGSETDALTLPTFITGSTSFDIDEDDGSITIGDGGTYNRTEIDDLKLDDDVNARFVESSEDFLVDKVEIKGDAVVTFESGTYWFESFKIEDDAVVTVTGPVTIYIRDDFEIKDDALLNASGQAQDLALVGYDKMKFKDDVVVKAVVYNDGGEEIKLEKNAQLSGAISASEKLELKDNATITYEDVSSVVIGDLCGEPEPEECTLGSFSITQDANGLACPSTRSTISITALCDDGTTVKEDYAGTINLTTDEDSESEFYLANSGGPTVTSVTLDGSESGAVDVYLFHQNENDDLRVTASDTSASVTTQASNGTDYRTAGFVVTDPNNFICGNNASMSITAIGQDQSGSSCSVIEGFDGNKDLKAWFTVNHDPLESPDIADMPETGLSLDGTLVNATSQPGSTNLNLAFSSGVANFNVAHSDVGKVMSLDFIHDEAPYDGSVSGISALSGGISSSGFIVSPNLISVSASGVNNDCASGDENCSPFVAAGSDFDLVGQALCSDGATLAQSYESNVPLSLNLIAPTPANGGVNGTLAVTQLVFNDSTNGSVTEGEQQISEVGVFTVTAAPPSYFDPAIVPSGSTTANIGRFIPADFSVTQTNQGALEPFCTVGTDFSYIGQSITYSSSDFPAIRVTALNDLGSTTQNYTGDFIKLEPLEVARVFPSADSGNSLVVNSDPEALVQQSESGGQINYRFNALDNYTYDKSSTSEINPFPSDLRIAVTGVNDGEALSTSVTVGAPVWVTPSDVELRYGRWVMDNAFGPENSALEIPMRVEYWDDVFITNVDDSCTTYNASNMSKTDSFENSATTTASGSGTVSSGSISSGGRIALSAPGEDNWGTAELIYNGDSWLSFDWDSDAGTVDTGPTSTATFGQYRGHDRIIYWREVRN